jgi:hypothetical protein
VALQLWRYSDWRCRMRPGMDSILFLLRNNSRGEIIAIAASSHNKNTSSHWVYRIFQPWSSAFYYKVLINPRYSSLMKYKNRSKTRVSSTPPESLFCLMHREWATLPDTFPTHRCVLLQTPSSLGLTSA